MKRVVWLAGTGVVALVALGGVLLLIINLYVQSPRVQQQIRRELSASLQMPVEIKKTTATPWDGLRIEGITAHSGAPDSAPDANAPVRVRLAADSFRARFSLAALLHRQLVVKQVLFDRPVLDWRQNPDGRWVWPGNSDAPAPTPAAEAEVADEQPTPSPAPGATTASPPAAETPAPVAAATPTPTPSPAAARRPLFPLAVELLRCKMRHGNLRLLDASGALFGVFEDINANSTLDTPERLRGRMWFSRLVLRERLAITAFNSDFTYEPDALVLKGGHGEIAGGRLGVDYSMRPAESGSPFHALCRFEDLSLSDLAVAAGLRSDAAAGKLQGEVEINGYAGDMSRQTGRAQFRILDGELGGMPFFQALGGAMHIEELQHLHFDSAVAECRLEGETIYLEPLTVIAPHLRLVARGRCLMGDETLDLQARLILAQTLSRQLPEFIADNFIPVADSTAGERYIDFHVTGPLSDPHTDLVDRAVTRPLRSMLQGFFGGATPAPAGSGKRNRRDKKDKTPRPAATPAAVAAAATTPPAASPAATPPPPAPSATPRPAVVEPPPAATLPPAPAPSPSAASPEKGKATGARFVPRERPACPAGGSAGRLLCA